ncbi:MAG: N-acetylneuraminate synthase family protein [Phycisphaerales bacterium]|nr:N-acetylneuraminate synthase family protein [Phycisphaerales bacterium]
MRIGDREIGLNHPPYIIAEIGVNHDGDVNRALELTDAAAQAGADAIKLQFFETDRLMSKAAKLAAYQKNAGETDPIKMLRRLELTIDEMALVAERAHSKGIHAIVTVFSTELVPIAETLPWDAYKTASPDIINYPLIRALAKTGKPMIISTGASTCDEVETAFYGYFEAEASRCAILQCVSCYPTKREDAQISWMFSFPPDFHYSGGQFGYSDHTADIDIGGLAVKVGACVLEKHLTYSRQASGPDHSASLEPIAFAKYVNIAQAASNDRVVSGDFGEYLYKPPTEYFLTDPAYGQSYKQVLDCEQDVRLVARQSITSTRDIPAGTTITKEMLTIKRPGTGIPPYKLNQILGSKTSQPIEADVPIKESDLVEFSSSLSHSDGRGLG